MSFFKEAQVTQAFDYLMMCKNRFEAAAADDDKDPYVCMVRYFDGEAKSAQEIPGITLRANYDTDTKTLHFMVTPYYEFWQYPQLKEDYEKILTTSFLVDKLQSLFHSTIDAADANCCIKVHNKHHIFAKPTTNLYDGFFEAENSFIYKF